jgi:hypothetical protein
MAIVDNAQWCDAVCRSHGIPTRSDRESWSGATRTPPYYPDAVTLVPNPDVRELLGRIDISPGCSIKDSFASLDLTVHGFRILFDAHWIARPKTDVLPMAAGPPWEQVRHPDTLALWENAWRGHDGPTGVFLPELLDQDSVAIVAACLGDRVMAGAVLHVSSSVVGISNVFAHSELVASCWSGCLAIAESLFRGATFVGYESGDALAEARRHGFETMGPLRVWILDSQEPGIVDDSGGHEADKEVGENDRGQA